MSNINVGTIFALETDLPKYSDLVKIASLSLREKRYSIKNWKLFSDLKDDSEINTYLNDKEKELLINVDDLVEGDLFFTSLLWMDTNMIGVRETFREAVSQISYQEKVAFLTIGLQQILFPDKEAWKSIMLIVEDLERFSSIFEVEKQLDKFVFEILERGAKGNKIKLAYLKNKRNYYKVSSKNRKDYLRGTGSIDAKVIDEMEKELAQTEIKFSNNAVINVDPDLVMIGYLVKIKYLMYDLRVLFNNVGKFAEDLMINYDFK
jgi:hypothetical protein